MNPGQQLKLHPTRLSAVGPKPLPWGHRTRRGGASVRRVEAPSLAGGSF